MNLSRGQLLSQLRKMDEYDFEHLVADVWEQRGWETTVTTGSSDRGIDVIAEQNSPFKQKHVIQAKRYSAGNKIGGPDIRNYEALKRQEDDVDAVVVVTTSSFSSQAHQNANDLNVKLVNGEDLCDMIFELNSQDFLSDYFQTGTKSVETANRAGSTVSTSSPGDDKSDNSSHPFDSDSANPTRDHKYFSDCPKCGEKRSIWYAQNNSRTLKCSNCGDSWLKSRNEGLLSSAKWKILDGKDERTIKTTKQWEEEAKLQSTTKLSTGSRTETTTSRKGTDSTSDTGSRSIRPPRTSYSDTSVEEDTDDVSSIDPPRTTSTETTSQSDSSQSIKSISQIQKEIESKLTEAREEGKRCRVVWEDTEGERRSLVAEYGKWGNFLSKYKGAKIESYPKTTPDNFSNIPDIYKTKNISHCTVIYTKSDKGINKENNIFNSIIKKSGGFQRLKHISFVG